MPELPEVEAVRRALEPELIGRTARGVRVYKPEIIQHPAAPDFVERLPGGQFVRLERRGKFLRFCLEPQALMVLHLRMTGTLSLVAADHPVPRHTHMILSLDDGRELRFTDMRRLGRLWLLDGDEEDRFTGMTSLGPEPYDISAADLRDAFEGRKRSVKSALMDQKLIAGIGNIYSDEILFRAGISPLRPAGSLDGPEIEKLVEVMPATLTEAVEKGVSCSTYLFGERLPRKQPYGWKVYGKKGKPCVVCGTPLTGVRIAGRSSVYCPNCQH